MTKLLFNVLILVVGMLFYFSVLKAQPGPPDPPVDNPVPITGLEYLIAAGAAFGGKKLYDNKKSKQ